MSDEEIHTSNCIRPRMRCCLLFLSSSGMGSDHLVFMGSYGHLWLHVVSQILAGEKLLDIG